MGREGKARKAKGAEREEGFGPPNISGKFTLVDKSETSSTHLVPSSSRHITVTRIWPLASTRSFYATLSSINTHGLLTRYLGPLI
jgi:hypothetical protein